MSRWLVSDLPAWVVLLGFIVVIVGSAISVQGLVRRRFPQLTGDAHNDVTKFVFGVVAFVFAFFLGFVVSTMWGQINNADAGVRAEGAAGVQLARGLAMLDPGDSDRIRQRLLDYGQAALAEWPQVALGQTTPAADDALLGLYRAYGQVQARDEAQKAILSTSFANLDKLSEARTERLLTARTDTGPPWSLWAVILLTSGLVLGCSIIYGVEKPGLHYPMVATVGVLVAADLFLVVQLSHPFIGEIGASAEPLHEMVRVLTDPVQRVTPP